MGLTHCIIGASAGVIAWKFVEKRLDARERSGGFSKPDLGRKELFGYRKGIEYCPNANLFPKGRFGKVMSSFGYYRRKNSD